MVQNTATGARWQDDIEPLGLLQFTIRIHPYYEHLPSSVSTVRILHRTAN
jgi:hypothetical protein